MGTGRASTRCCPRALSEQSPASPLALSRYAGARVYGTVEKVWSGVSAVVAVCYDQPRQTARFRHSRWRTWSAARGCVTMPPGFMPLLFRVPRSELLCFVVYCLLTCLFFAQLPLLEALPIATNEFALSPAPMQLFVFPPSLTTSCCPSLFPLFLRLIEHSAKGCVVATCIEG